MIRSQHRVTLIGMHYAPEPSGNAPYTTALAGGLARRGHRVHVVTGVPHYPSWQVLDGFDRWRATTDENGARVTRLRHHVAARPTSASRVVMEATFGLRAVAMRRHSPDVVIAVSPALVSSAMAVARERLVPGRAAVGLWVQDLYSLGVREANGASARAVRWAGAFEGRVARATDGVAVVHPRFADYVTDALRVPRERVTVIRNWTHLVSTPCPDRSLVRQSFGWPDGTVVAVHAGNMGVKQGLQNVVEAARLAAMTGAAVKFVLVGGGNQREALKHLAAGLPTLEFLPPLPDRTYQDVLAAADVLLVNEKPGVTSMSVPSKLTSYYTSGRPVVAACETASVTAAELRLSGAGVRVDPGRPERLLAASVALGSDVVTADDLGRRGRSFVERVLSEEAALDRFEDWMSRLLSVRHARRARPADASLVRIGHRSAMQVASGVTSSSE